MEPRAYLTVAVLLFCIGMTGFLTRRNLLIIFLSIELMLNAGAFALITFARLWGRTDPQVLFFLALALAAAESAVGLSLVIAIWRHRHETDATSINELKG